MSEHLLLKRKSLQEWRSLARSTHKRQYQHLLDHVSGYLTSRPPEEHPDDSITYTGAAVANLALAYLLSEDERFLSALRQWMDVVIHYPHWGKHRKPDHDLDAAWLLFGLGLVYNWLGAELSEEERSRLKAKLLLQGRRMFAYATEIKGDWTYHFWQNHNWICFAGLATAGYALKNEAPEAETWCDTALENFKSVFSLLPDDGSDYEGATYWRYGIPWLLIADHLFEEQVGIALRDLSGFLSKTFFFRLYISGPNLVDTAHFGDCHDRRSAHSKAVLYRLASLFRNGYAQWLASYFDEIGEWDREAQEGLVRPGLGPEAFLEFLWFDPMVEPTPVQTLPHFHVFADLGLASVRTGWDRDATVLVYKCSQPSGYKPWHYGHALFRKYGWHTISAGHAHPDEHTFVLMKGNDHLVVDEGYNRTCYSRYHSTLLVDGKGQYQEGGYNVFEGLGADWGGRLDEWLGLDGLFYVRGEAVNAYDRSLQLHNVSRDMLFIDGEMLLVHDYLRSEVPHRYQWLLQMDAPPLKEGEDRFVLHVGKSTMGIHIHHPSSVVSILKEQQVSANPTSANPKWVLTRTLHTLFCEPPDPVEEAEFLVSLTLQGHAAALPTERGRLVSFSGKRGEWVIGVGKGGVGLSVDGLLLTDASCVALSSEEEVPTRGLAVHASMLWWKGMPLLISSPPVSIAWRWSSSTHLDAQITSLRKVSLSVRCPGTPQKVVVNGEEVEFSFSRDVSLVRFVLPGGELNLELYCSHK
ncbi:hypothetical protein Spith_1747 [Spirochaeta thermophila DSM 6578]|uniref:Uncharacterized protein n=2 Tax=Winmispira thermophila TaxID=154 RepID=G0GBZ6_WINT7|nr:hypothetical protein Spith_1747 [Spirochaeta thermophila DSM 6578]